MIYRKNYNVILDLDNTLISTQHVSENTIRGLVDYSVWNEARIYPRPFLQYFLHLLFSYYNVSVWTAAQEDYAKEVVYRFIKNKPDRKLDFVLSRNHCDISRQLYGNIKDLRLIFDVYKIQGYNIHNTIIIDDNQLVKMAQPLHCHQIKPFVHHLPDATFDSELLYLLDVIHVMFGNLFSSFY